MLSYLFGIETPVWVSYGYLPIILTLGVHYIPYTFILMRGTLANIDSRLEESAELLGAGRLEVLRRITFPLVLPALGSAFILTFSKGLGGFAAQAFLGLPVRFYTISTRIYSALNNRLYGEGYVLAFILILTTIAMVWANQAILGTRKGFVTVEGKGSRKKPVDLHRWRWPVTLALLLFVILFVVAPLLLLGWQTLMRYDGQYGLDNLTLHYWFGASDPDLADGQPGIFKNPVILNAIKNSVSLAGSTALISGLIGILIGYAVIRNRGRLSAAFTGKPFFRPVHDSRHRFRWHLFNHVRTTLGSDTISVRHVCLAVAGLYRQVPALLLQLRDCRHAPDRCFLGGSRNRSRNWMG